MLCTVILPAGIRITQIFKLQSSSFLWLTIKHFLRQIDMYLS